MLDLVFREGVFDAGLDGREEDGLIGRPSRITIAPETVAGIVAVLLAGGGLDRGPAPPAGGGGRSAGLWKKAGLLDLMAGRRE